ncbi:MAG: hypothetical protein AB7G21_01710 [Dehalococcoidia bacterium]
MGAAVLWLLAAGLSIWLMRAGVRFAGRWQRGEVSQDERREFALGAIEVGGAILVVLSLARPGPGTSPIPWWGVVAAVAALIAGWLRRRATAGMKSPAGDEVTRRPQDDSRSHRQ